MSLILVCFTVINFDRFRHSFGRPREHWVQILKNIDENFYDLFLFSELVQRNFGNVPETLPLDMFQNLKYF